MPVAISFPQKKEGIKTPSNPAELSKNPPAYLRVKRVATNSAGDGRGGQSAG